MAASAWPLSLLPQLLSALVFYKARHGYTRQCPQRTLKMEKHLCKYKEAGVTFCKRMISLQERCVCGRSTQIKEIPGPLRQPRDDPSPMEGRGSVLEGVSGREASAWTGGGSAQGHWQAEEDPGAHSPGSSHHTEGFTCRAVRSPRASSVCSKITWALEQSGRPSSSRKTANESADCSNPRVKGVLAGAWAGLSLPTNSAGAKNDIIH